MFKVYLSRLDERVEYVYLVSARNEWGLSEPRKAKYRIEENNVGVDSPRSSVYLGNPSNYQSLVSIFDNSLYEDSSNADLKIQISRVEVEISELKIIETEVKANLLRVSISELKEAQLQLIEIQTQLQQRVELLHKFKQKLYFQEEIENAEMAAQKAKKINPPKVTFTDSEDRTLDPTGGFTNEKLKHSIEVAEKRIHTAKKTKRLVIEQYEKLGVQTASSYQAVGAEIMNRIESQLPDETVESKIETSDLSLIKNDTFHESAQTTQDIFQQTTRG